MDNIYFVHGTEIPATEAREQGGGLAFRRCEAVRSRIRVRTTAMSTLVLAGAAGCVSAMCPSLRLVLRIFRTRAGYAYLTNKFMDSLFFFLVHVLQDEGDKR